MWINSAVFISGRPAFLALLSIASWSSSPPPAYPPVHPPKQEAAARKALVGIYAPRKAEDTSMVRAQCGMVPWCQRHAWLTFLQSPIEWAGLNASLIHAWTVNILQSSALVVLQVWKLLPKFWAGYNHGCMTSPSNDLNYFLTFKSQDTISARFYCYSLLLPAVNSGAGHEKLTTAS